MSGQSHKRASSDPSATDTAAVAHPSAAGSNALEQERVRLLSLGVRADVIGHASPRWDHPGDNTASDLNLELSDRRATETATLLEEAMLQASGGQLEVAPLTTHAAGDHTTFAEAMGDEQADGASLRRADVSMDLEATWEATGSATEEERHEVLELGLCASPNATKRWGIKTFVSGGAGVGPAAGGFVQGELKNMATGEVKKFILAFGGAGAGLASPGGWPTTWSDWEVVETAYPVDFWDWQRTPFQINTASAGFLIGGSATTLLFPRLDVFTKGISPSMGVVGADVVFGGGVLQFTDTVTNRETCPEPKPGYYTTTEEVDHTTVYDTTSHESYRAHFDTGSAEMSSEELMQLIAWSESVVASAPR